MWSGIERLWPHLVDLVDRGGQLRLLTGDYLDITEPAALQRMLDLKAAHPSAVQLRVFAEAGTSFHPKAYILVERAGCGVAYVGSSNLSRSALEEGDEWNYRVMTSRDGHGFQQASEAFEGLFGNLRTLPIDGEWLEGYAARRAAGRLSDEKLLALRASCERFEAMSPADDLREVVRENFVFHNTILEAAGSTRLSGMVRQVVELPLVYKSYVWYSPEQARISQHYHRQITRALERRAAERAELVMKEHVLEARDVLIAHIEEGRPTGPRELDLT
jgi:HKD family nuclease